MLRVFRSSKARFARDMELADQVYTEDELKRLADAGFNAVWVRTISHQLLKHPKYPSFGPNAEALQASMNRVIERGAKVGVKVVSYCQEPFALERDDPFWDEHPDMAGAPGDRNWGDEDDPLYLRSFCVSVPAVRGYIADSMENMFRALPGLGGVITITASEYLQHCYSHNRASNVNFVDGNEGSPVRCPRCAERHPTDLVVDILNSMREGIDRVDRARPLIAWNWSWNFYEPDPQTKILDRLAPGVDIQGDFERGDEKVDPFGKKILVDEYSLSFVGPSRRFQQIEAAAKERGRNVYAKLQISTTHEIATVSNLPLIDNLYEKTRAFKERALAGFMGSWNFGNELTLNTRAFNFFLSDACAPEKDAALRRLVEIEFPGADADGCLRAWATFRRAFDHYPFCIPFLYYSPINYAIALPMTPTPTKTDKRIGRAWHMDERDDSADPSKCFGPFTPEEIVERLEKVSEIWDEGMVAYEEALTDAGGAKDEELSPARAVQVSLRSVWNYFRLYLLKREWRDELLPQFREIVRDEIETVDRAIPIYEADSRQGFHIEPFGAMVTPQLLREKRKGLEQYS